MKQSKLLFLSHDSDLQGAERSLLDLVTHLDRNRFQPLVVLPWPGPLEEKLKHVDIPYLVRFFPRWIPSRHVPRSYLSKWLFGLRARLWSLLSLIERERIDLVYTNTSTLLEGALAARRVGLPHVWHVREHLRNNADLRLFLPASWIDRLTLKLADRIITPSKTLAEARFSGSNKVRVVPNGIDLRAFAAGDGERVRAELTIPPAAPVITFIGAISHVKDPTTFVHACALVHRRFPEAHFLLAGADTDSPLAHQVRALVQSAGFGDHFRFLGYRQDAADLLAAATVHVSTSKQESFGRTLIEAMAAGKPVVATRCGGPEEVVVDGETGFIVPPGNPEAVASAIITLLAQPDLAKAMGNAGRIRAHRCFSVQAYAEKIGEIIDEVCK